ncbi:asialoglycoprotein receptor 2-like [Pomacea canaliculata]|uniref:asialoglycoprotein receptor 2-like n=1 Tax=Pomacea canaliculata TaxID=400727 RepID=UPI000D72D0A5|nr:asialoglycoprotein receptor 2-like [Pomacea canaliculata]
MVQTRYIHITIITTLLLLGGGQACDNEWTSYDNSCYMLGADQVTWTDAEEMCRLVSADLVKIESADENDFVKRLVVSHNAAHSVWIAATDVFSEGKFTWLPEGEPVIFTDWAAGEPNHFTGPESEDCVMLDIGKSWHWNDNSCSTTAYFVCEMRDDSLDVPVPVG